MDRRTFITSALAGAGGFLSIPAATLMLGRGDGFEIRPEDICSSGPRPSRGLDAAMAAEAGLRYEGTHILTHGALRDIAREYKGDVPFIVSGGGCDDGITAVRRGDAELGGMCCPVEGSRGEGLKSVVIAHDIKVAVVHPSSPVRDVTRRALAEVAAGRTTRWSALGGGDRAIALVVREHCPEYREPIRTLLLGGGAWSRKAILVKTDKEIVETVARFPGSLGLVSWVFARPLVEAGQLAVLSVDGEAPTAAAVATGRYPLHGPLSLVFSAWRDDMRPLFDFIFSPQGRSIIAQSLLPVDRARSGYTFG